LSGVSKPEGSFTPTTADALDSHLHAQLGDKADATLAAALATFELMPPDGQAWLQNGLSRLDTHRRLGGTKDGVP